MSRLRILPVADFYAPFLGGAEQHVEMLSRTARTAVQRLGFTGLFCVGLLSDDGTPLLVELSPQIFGSWAAVQRAGSGLVSACLKLLAGGAGPASDPVGAGWYSTTLYTVLLGKLAHEDRPTSVLTEVRDGARMRRWRWLVVRAVEMATTRRRRGAS